MEIAGRDDVGRTDQAADRCHQPVGEGEADPHRRQQHRQRDDRVHQRERDLDAEAARFEIGVFGDAGLGLADLCQHLGIDESGDVEIDVVITAQPGHRADEIGVAQEPDLRHLHRLGQRLRRRHRRRLHFRGKLDIGLEDDGRIRSDHHRGRQVAQRGLGGEKLAEPFAVLVEHRLGAGDVDRHGVGVGPDRLGVLADISVRHDE
jgi:hypothetical protein